MAATLSDCAGFWQRDADQFSVGVASVNASIRQNRDCPAAAVQKWRACKFDVRIRRRFGENQRPVFGQHKELAVRNQE